MRIYLKNNLTNKFHPDSIWNDGALGFFEEGRPKKKKKKNNNNNNNNAIK